MSLESSVFGLSWRFYLPKEWYKICIGEERPRRQDKTRSPTCGKVRGFTVGGLSPLLSYPVSYPLSSFSQFSHFLLWEGVPVSSTLYRSVPFEEWEHLQKRKWIEKTVSHLYLAFADYKKWKKTESPLLTYLFGTIVLYRRT